MGLYGWASSPYEDMDSNIGLEDGRLALEWTQKHISKFGGNPENVIAMGQSAGAGILELIIAESRYQKIPFQRALLSSSDLPPKRTVTAQREEIYQTLLDLTKCTTLQCIKALSEAELSEVNDIMVSKMQNYGGGGNFGPGMGFGPLVDGKTVHDLTPVLLSEQHHKTGLQGLIVGSMQNEVDVSSRVDARDTDFFQASTLSSDQDMPQAFPSLVRRILRSASNATASTVQSLYHYPQDLPEKLAWDWTGDAVFFCHALALVVRFKEITRRYIMSIPPTVHAQDLSYYFYPNFDLGFEVNQTIARAFQRLLGDFMYERSLTFGSPAGKAENWDTFEGSASILNITVDGFTTRTIEDDVARCEKVNTFMVDVKNGI